VTPLGKSVPLAANGSVAPIAPDPACALRTMRALRDEEFDVVHIHEPLVPGPAMTAALVADHTIGTFHRAGTDRVYSVLGRAARPVANRLRVRAAVSVDAVRTAQGILGGTYELLFNGVEVDRYAKADPIDTDGPTVLFLGRHEPRKGLEVLLAAVEGDALPADARVWIAGTGPQTAELQARYADNHRLEWLGPLSEVEKARRFRSADVYCTPSLGGESFGLVLLEAMASSTAVVASDIPGHRNVVTAAGEQGMLVPPGDPVALGATLRQVLADGTLRQRLVDAGDARADEFSMDRLAERYLALYAGVLDA
jgi:phosphatidylinositol alpha-mannosyltransferase